MLNVAQNPPIASSQRNLAAAEPLFMANAYKAESGPDIELFVTAPAPFVELNIFDSKIAPRPPGNIVARGMRAVADLLGDVVGNLFGMPKGTGTPASRDAPLAVYEFERLGIRVSPNGDIKLPNTAEAGAALAYMVVAANAPGDRSFFPGVHALNRVDPQALRDKGFSEEFAQAYGETRDSIMTDVRNTTLVQIGGTAVSGYLASKLASRMSQGPGKLGPEPFTGTTIDMQKGGAGRYVPALPSESATTGKIVPTSQNPSTAGANAQNIKNHATQIGTPPKLADLAAGSNVIDFIAQNQQVDSLVNASPTLQRMLDWAQSKGYAIRFDVANEPLQCSYCNTDGKEIVLNRQHMVSSFNGNVSPPNMIGLLAHELGHLVHEYPLMQNPAADKATRALAAGNEDAFVDAKIASEASAVLTTTIVGDEIYRQTGQAVPIGPTIERFPLYREIQQELADGKINRDEALERVGNLWRSEPTASGENYEEAYRRMFRSNMQDDGGSGGR